MYTFVPICCQDSASATADEKTMMTMIKDERGPFEVHFFFSQ